MLAEVGFDMGIEYTHFEPLPDQSRWHRVECVLDCDQRELTHARVNFFVVVAASLGQRLQTSPLYTERLEHSRIRSCTDLGDKLTVIVQCVELAASAQQQSLLDEVFEAALTRFNCTILVASSAIVASGAHPIALAQLFVASGQLLALAQ